MRAGLSASAWTIVVAFGVSVLVAASPSYSPVADAAKAGDLQSVRTFLQQGADVNAAQGDGMSALHWAAVLGDAQMAEMLIYAGANVMAETRIGHYTPLHVAAKGGKASVVETLLEVSEVWKLSRERVRQVEAEALVKMRKALRSEWKRFLEVA